MVILRQKLEGTAEVAIKKTVVSIGESSQVGLLAGSNSMRELLSVIGKIGINFNELAELGGNE